MIRLTNTNQSLEITLTSTQTSTAPVCVVCYSDKGTATYAGGAQVTTCSGTAVVTICSAPGANTVRDIDSISWRNRDTVSHTPTFRYNDNSSIAEIYKATLLTQERVGFTHANDWKATDANGNLKEVTASIFSSITDTGLTSGRVTYATTGGLLTDAANLTFNGTTLTAHTLTVSTGNLTVPAGKAFVGTAAAIISGADLTGFLAADAGALVGKNASSTNGTMRLWNSTADGPLIQYYDATGTARGTTLIENPSAKIRLTGTFGVQIYGDATTKAADFVGADTTLAGDLTVSGTTVNMTTSGTTLTVGVGADNGTVSAGVFTDRTKAYEGDALAELDAIITRNGQIDHATLPTFVRANVKKDIVENVQRQVEEEVDGKLVTKTVTEVVKTGERIEVERDLGAMISMLTVAVRQINTRLAAVEARR